HYISVCPFTPYTNELMLPQLSELIEGYEPDGFFFDTMGALRPCYCDCCKRDFEAATGKEIPVDLDDSLQATYGQFRHDRGHELLGRVGSYVQDGLPDAKVGFNQIGSLPNPEPLPDGVTDLTLDPPTYGPQISTTSLNAAFGSTADVTADVMPTIFNLGWGDWSPSPDQLLEQVSTTAWVRNARLYMGDRLHPKNRLDRRTRHALSVLSNLHDSLEAEMPPEGTAMAPDILVLHGTSVTYGTDMSRYQNWNVRNAIDGTLGGAHRLLLDAGANFTVVGECYLRNWIDRAGLLVIPEMVAIEPETESALLGFVEKGGNLLVVGSAPTVDGKPLDWLGVEPLDDPWQDHIYLPPWEDEPEVLVRSDFHKGALAGARMVCPATPAWDARHGHLYGWGIGPACDEPSEFPVLTCNTVGDGCAWSLRVSLFSDYAQQGTWPQAGWFSGMLDRMGFRRRAYLDSPWGRIELVVYADERTTWSALVHHAGEEVIGIAGEKTWARSVGPLPRMEVTLHVDAGDRRPAGVTMRGQAVDHEVVEEEVIVPVSMDCVWRIVRVDWE
ncbi:MAG: hypothetical protein QGI83_12880, partial [Candidatus Latescibacteria bacterium]|nr:hypothetical protein [Candidatus Latescibacterota bacterium]